MTLKDKTIFITGASRGIGREIALRCARDGANLALAAKTVSPHPKLAGTIHSVASEVEAAGGRALRGGGAGALAWLAWGLLCVAMARPQELGPPLAPPQPAWPPSPGPSSPILPAGCRDRR